MSASSQRVATLHIAKLKKQANLKERLADALYDPLMSKITEEAGQAISSSVSREAKEGWSKTFKGTSISKLPSLVKSKGASFDLTDPLQKLVHESIKGKGPQEKIDIVGRFNKAYLKRDIEGMANALNVEKELVLVVLLWYTRNSKSAVSWNRSRRNMERALQHGPATLSRIIKDFPPTVLKAASWITGGSVIEWLVKLVPKGEVVAKPLKWAWWTALVLNRWTVISSVTKWAVATKAWLIATLSGKGFFAWLLKFLATTLPTLIVKFVTFFFGTFVPMLWPLLVVLALAYFQDGFWKHLGGKGAAAKTGIVHSLMANVKALWMIVKAVIQGALSVPKAIYEEIREYVIELSTSGIFGKKRITEENYEKQAVLIMEGSHL